MGLYLDLPANAVVVSVDEKSQIEALDRTAPMLPPRPGLPARQSYDSLAAVMANQGSMSDLAEEIHWDGNPNVLSRQLTS